MGDTLVVVSNRYTESRFEGIRVRVEHAITRLKCFRTLSDRYQDPRGRFGVKISTIVGILNIATEF